MFSTIFYPCYLSDCDNGWRVFTGTEFNGNMGTQGPVFETEEEAKAFCKQQPVDKD